MTITPTLLTSGSSGSPSAPHSTASVSPGSNRLILLIVAAATSTFNTVTSITATGNGLTWVEVGSVAYGSRRRLTVLRAMGASPSTGAISITVNASAGATGLIWHVLEYNGVVTTGTNGSDAFVSAATNSGNGTSGSATSGGTPATGDYTFGALAFEDTIAVTNEAGWDERAETDETGNVRKLISMDDADQDLSPSWSWASANGWAALAGIIKAAAATGTTVDVPTATLSLTGQAPTVVETDDVWVAVPVASLTLTGQAPTVVEGANLAVEVPAASLAFTGQAPTIVTTADLTIAVPAGALALTGLAPVVDAEANVWVDVPAAALALTGQVPIVNTGANVTVEPPVATLTLTGQAPTVIEGANLAVEVPAAALTLTGLAPTVDEGANVTVDVPAATLTLTGQAPTVATTNDVTVAVPVAALTLVGLAPTITTTGDLIVAIPASTLTLTGLEPTVIAGASIVVGVPVAALVFTAYAPAALGDEWVEVPAALLRLTSYAPLVTAEAPPPGGDVACDDDSHVADVIAGRHAPIHRTWRYEVITRRGAVLRDITRGVLSHRINGDNNRLVIEDATFSICPDLIPGEEFDPVGAYLQVTSMTRMLGDWLEHTRGVFRLSQPIERHDADRTIWTVDGVGMLADLVEQENTDTYVVPRGRNYVQEVRFLLDALGYEHDIAPTTAVTPTELSWPPFTTQAQIANDLLFGCNFYPLFNEDGNHIFKSRERLLPAEDTIAVAYGTETPPRMIVGPMAITRPQQRVPNRMSMQVNDPFRPLQYVNRQNNDPASPNSVLRRGASDTPTIDGNRVADAYGEKYADPATALTTGGTAIAWRPDGSQVAVGQAAGEGGNIYAFSESTGIVTALTGLTGLAASSHVMAMAYHPSGNALAVATDISPFVHVYRIDSGGVATKYADPATLPAGIASGVAWSPDGLALLVSHANAPYVSAYSFSVGLGLGAKLADPATLAHDDATGVAIDPAGDYVVLGHWSAPYVTAYSFDSVAGWGSQLAAPSLAIPGRVNALAFSPAGDEVALALFDPPYVLRLGFAAGWGSPKGAPTGNPPAWFGLSVEYRPLGDDALLVGTAVRYDSTTYFPDGSSVTTSGNDLTAGHEGVRVHPLDGDTTGASPQFPSLTLGSVQSARWHPGGLIIALAHYNAPHVTILRYQGGDVMRQILDYELAVEDTKTYLADTEIIFDPRRRPHEIISLAYRRTDGTIVAADGQRWFVHDWEESSEPSASMRLSLGLVRALDFEDFE